jgi:DNA-binding response OmpR family regulator
MLEPVTVVEAEDEAGVAGAASPRLLVIDDDHLHRMIICRVANKAGYTPVAAASYEEAAALAQDTAFDCVTLDLSLGAHAGVEMLRHLWVLGCKAPILIISGCDDAVCRETVRVARSLNLNVREPIPKPVDLSLLRYSLERLRPVPADAVVSE